MWFRVGLDDGRRQSQKSKWRQLKREGSFYEKQKGLRANHGLNWEHSNE